MNVMWIALVVAAAEMLRRGLGWPQRRDGESDLGYVSQRWLAERRIVENTER